MDLERSPLARPFPDIPPIAGVTLRVARARYKTWDRCDLTYAELAEGTAVAGVFTRSACPSSEVELGREQVKAGRARALIVNAGNSNAFTGYRGREAVEQIMAQVADKLGCTKEEVFVSSTGVIGVPLPKDKAREGVEAALGAQPCSWEEAAHTIGTTDTFTKGAHASAMIGDTRVEIGGIVKGSGMIAPDMATMLGFIATDAALPQPVLAALLADATDRSFNAITVDSDTSTNDSVYLMASGAAGNAEVTAADDPALDGFCDALDRVMQDLARQIVRDGEGATKFITITVTGAANDGAAHSIGMSIANSPLVKTAIAGEDANWGRIVMAVGKSGAGIDQSRLDISMGGVLIAAAGARLDDYDEAPVAAHMKGEEVDIAVKVGDGAGAARVWTCDLTHGYISINADYRS